jgi:SAM-dependent methyltransferase
MSMPDNRDFAYVGTELDVFALATNWKRYWAQAIRRYLGPSVLDVGAGKGATARLLAGAAGQHWLALEPDAELADCIRRDVAAGDIAGNCEVKVGTLDTLSPDQQFDTILYIDVLEHIEADRDELMRAARYLKPTGRIVVLSPAHNWLYTPFDKALGHFRRYSEDSLRAATPTGLVAERVFYLDSVGMLASLGNRLILNSAHPNAKQIRLWDRWMVPISRLIDPLIGNRLGKSIVGVWRLAEAAAATLL